MTEPLSPKSGLSLHVEPSLVNIDFVQPSVLWRTTRLQGLNYFHQHPRGLINVIQNSSTSHLQWSRGSDMFVLWISGESKWRQGHKTDKCGLLLEKNKHPYNYKVYLSLTLRRRTPSNLDLSRRGHPYVIRHNKDVPTEIHVGTTEEYPLRGRRRRHYLFSPCFWGRDSGKCSYFRQTDNPISSSQR